MELTIIGEIRDKYEQKIIKRNCNRILKKFNPKSTNDLYNLMELATVLYTLGEYDDVIKVCNVLDNILFDGNYTLWFNVKKTRLIKCKALQDKGLKKEAVDVLNTIMPYEHMELWGNQKDSLEICDANIEEAEKYGLKSEALTQKILKISEMIRFLVLPKFPIDKKKTTIELADAIKELNSILK